MVIILPKAEVYTYKRRLKYQDSEHASKIMAKMYISTKNDLWVFPAKSQARPLLWVTSTVRLSRLIYSQVSKLGYLRRMKDLSENSKPIIYCFVIEKVEESLSSNSTLCSKTGTYLTALYCGLGLLEPTQTFTILFPSFKAGIILSSARLVRRRDGNL